MSNQGTPQFRIYPSIGIARVGNGPANKDDVVFSPEVPWANLYDTDTQFHTRDGALKKMAQRFYIYECDRSGNPVRKIDPAEYDITWTAEVANKKPFWYDFNNSLDLSTQSSDAVLSPRFLEDRIAPGICTSYRNPNVLNEGLRVPNGPNYRKELVNNPAAVQVSADGEKKNINGQFPSSFKHDARRKSAFSLIAEKLNSTAQRVKLGTIEHDNGALIFYAGDGISAALNPSDLNTDFADNSNWYDDICDGRITATITHKATGASYELNDAESAAWIATAPPNYAPQIDPIATMYDLVSALVRMRITSRN